MRCEQLCILTLLGLADTVFAIHPVFFEGKITYKQTKTFIMLKLFYNPSIILEQICSFKTSVTVELTV